MLTVTDKQTDYYKILGIAATASKDEIQRAYEKKLRETQDTKPTAALARAYEVLSNSYLKISYDLNRNSLQAVPSLSDQWRKEQEEHERKMEAYRRERRAQFEALEKQREEQRRLQEPANTLTRAQERYVPEAEFISKINTEIQRLEPKCRFEATSGSFIGAINLATGIIQVAVRTSDANQMSIFKADLPADKNWTGFSIGPMMRDEQERVVTCYQPDEDSLSPELKKRYMLAIDTIGSAVDEQIRDHAAVCNPHGRSW